MAFTVTQLITRAFNMARIVSKEFETVTGEQFSTGLLVTNDVLSSHSIDIGMIPYESTGTFTGVIGQEKYSIPGLVKLDTLTFEIDTLRYPMRELGRNVYQGSARTNDINSLAFCYNVERELNGSVVSVYFTPDQNYVFTWHGLTAQSEVALNDDISLTMEQWFRKYLALAVAEELCAEYSYPIPAAVERPLMRYRAYIKKQSRKMDLHISKVSTLRIHRGGMNYAQANLGHGWTTP